MGSPRLPRHSAHRSAVDAALREHTRQCELLGGVEAAFSEVARVNRGGDRG